MDIVIDFDGTCVTHDFPVVGKDIGAVAVLKELVAYGHNLILFTMRSDVEDPQSEDPEIVPVGGNYLTDAVNWFKENDIPLYGIQKNPTQHRWTHSPKAYGQLIIDDAALGCPLMYDITKSRRPFVNWKIVREMLVKQDIIPYYPEPTCMICGDVCEVYEIHHKDDQMWVWCKKCKVDTFHQPIGKTEDGS